MKRKGASLLLFFLCLLLSGCDADLMTDSQRFEAVNEAFGESGLVFSEAQEFPDMPDGAVLVFDAEDTKQAVTEVYLEDIDPLIKAIEPQENKEKTLFFICEQERLLVVLAVFYHVEEPPESPSKAPQVISPWDLPSVPVGNTIEEAGLPGGAWRVYCIRNYMTFDNTENGIRHKKNAIKDNLLFLLDHWRNASDIR